MVAAIAQHGSSLDYLLLFCRIGRRNRVQKVFPPDLSVSLVGAHQRAFAKRVCRLARHGNFEDPLPASLDTQVVACGAGHGAHLWSADIGDAPCGPGAREFYQASRDLPRVYGLAEES